jgi:hypothetical protein
MEIITLILSRIAEKALADASLILSTLYGINNVTAKMHLTD